VPPLGDTVGSSCTCTRYVPSEQLYKHLYPVVPDRPHSLFDSFPAVRYFLRGIGVIFSLYVSIHSTERTACQRIRRALHHSFIITFSTTSLQDRKVTLDLVRRAEKAGYKALAVTVDTPVLGRREADIRNKFSLPSHLTMGKM
jgi:hypothetical protein